MQNQHTTTQICKACKTAQSTSQSVCSHCGFPLAGTEAEQQQFMVYREVSQTDFETHQKHVNSARNALLWMAVISFLPVPLLFIMGAHGNNLIFALIKCGVTAASFLGLAVWSVKKPTAALITGLCIYIIMLFVTGMINPSNIKPDILSGVIIIFCLADGIHSSIKADKLVKQYKFS